MNQDPHYTLFVIPDKSPKLWRLRVPAWIMHGSFLMLGLLLLFGGVLAWNYTSVLSHVEENRTLRQHQRDLQTRIQLFDRRMKQVEQQILRIQSLSDRLRMMLQLDTNVLEAEGLQLPQGLTAPDWPTWKSSKEKHSRLVPRKQPALDLETLLADLTLQEKSSLSLEQELHEELEALMDQRAFLRALPTRAPAEGLFTSGFGVRSSPLGGGAVKMHEGRHQGRLWTHHHP
jgi:hypothetical protein